MQMHDQPRERKREWEDADKNSRDWQCANIKIQRTDKGESDIVQS